MQAIAALVEGVLCGDVRSVARAITAVEDRAAQATDILAALFHHAVKARVVRVTGPPGAGKSTLVDRMTRRLRAQRKTVGTVAVDPRRPFSGGAILAPGAAELEGDGALERTPTRDSIGGESRKGT